MNRVIVADSSGIISLVSETDNNHKRALAISEKFSKRHGSIIVPEDVLSETLNIAGKKLGKHIAISLGDILLTNETFVIMDIGEDVRRKAFDLFRKQPQSVSFTDCVVMATADMCKTRIIFGFDEVFRKHGYALDDGEVA